MARLAESRISRSHRCRCGALTLPLFLLPGLRLLVVMVWAGPGPTPFVDVVAAYNVPPFLMDEYLRCVFPFLI